MQNTYLFKIQLSSRRIVHWRLQHYMKHVQHHVITMNNKLPFSLLFGLKLTTCGWLSESGLRKILLTGGQDLIGGLGGRGVLSGVFLR